MTTPPGKKRSIRHGGLMRLRGMMKKEFLQIIRDPSSIAIAFIMPLILLFIFGYGVSLDAKHVPIAIVVERPSAQTAGLTGAFARSEYLWSRIFPSSGTRKSP